MGQYYLPYIKNLSTGNVSTTSPFDWGGGMKLMETCYVDDAYVSVIMYSLQDASYFAMVGDYAEIGDVPEENDEMLQDGLYRLHNNNNSKFAEVDNLITPDNIMARATQCTAWKFYDYNVKRYILNHTKKQYLSVEDIIRAPADKYGMKLNPLTILCSVGNGRGGGDYQGKNMNKVGSWAFDMIQFVYGENLEPPSDPIWEKVDADIFTEGEK